MTDPVDEWVVQSLTEYQGKTLKSAEKGDLDLDKADEAKQKEYSDLFDFIKSKLEDKVKEVKPSTRLKDSMACLSGDAYDMSAYMEKILKASGQKVPETKRVLEINTEHPVLSKIKGLFEKDKENPVLKDYSQMLFDVAVISEGGKVDNPARFSKTLADLMDSALA
jgi:molecular chaperone HtpG